MVGDQGIDGMGRGFVDFLGEGPLVLSAEAKIPRGDDDFETWHTGFILFRVSYCYISVWLGLDVDLSVYERRQNLIQPVRRRGGRARRSS
jgi:hypothetical protein